jgi:hypothetical protein
MGADVEEVCGPQLRYPRTSALYIFYNALNPAQKSARVDDQDALDDIDDANSTDDRQ